MNSTAKRGHFPPATFQTYIFRMHRITQPVCRHLPVWAQTAIQAQQAIIKAYGKEWEGFRLHRVTSDRFLTGISCD